MPIVHQSRLVAYSAEQMYQLVNDYEKYPQFLSGCVSAKTIRASELELDAELQLQKFGISQKFSTHNTLVPNQRINMQLIEGPFRHLHGYWEFTPFDEKSSHIILHLEFEFNSAMISMIFGKIFDELTQKMIGGFKKRAKEVYGGK